MSKTRERILQEIWTERRRQDELHPRFPEVKRLAVLVEEVGEVSKALQDKDNDELEAELLQVASVAIRWIEHLRRTP